MPLNPKCLVKKMLEQNHEVTDAELVELAHTVPLANYCIQCARRLGNALEKFCWKNM